MLGLMMTSPGAVARSPNAAGSSPLGTGHPLGVIGTTHTASWVEVWTWYAIAPSSSKWPPTRSNST